MNLLEARDIVLAECSREKRIVTRNTVIIALLVISVLGAIYAYALPQISKLLSTANIQASSSPYDGYYKWSIVLGLAICIVYPLVSLYKVISRGKRVLKAFDKVSDGKNYKIQSEETKYLTTIPLYWIKLKLSPVHYVTLNIENKLYALPVPQIVAVKLKTALNRADTGKIYSINEQLFGTDEIRDESLNHEKVNYPTLESFKEFTTRELEEDLKSMEGSRKSTKNAIVLQFMFAIVFIGTLFYVSFFNPNIFSSSKGIYILIGSVIGGSALLSVLFMWYTKQKASSGKFNDYTDFKKSIFSRVVKFVNPMFEYVENGHIEHSHLAQSGLFNEEYYRITGGDQIIGAHNGIPFQSCNLLVTYRPNFQNEKESDDVVFTGNYFVARFNKRFQYPIYIHPKKGIFGKTMDNQIAQYVDKSKNKIKLEDPEFAKQFNVYCDDEIIARYVLTPAMMQRIKEINIRSEGNLYIAINEKNIVLANNSGNTSMNMDGTGTSLFTKIDESLLNHLFEDLIADLSMIETLKLNVNIWKN